MKKEWQDILDRVEFLHGEAKKEATSLWFRGQRSSHWPLQSSLHRRIEDQFKALGDPSNTGGKQQQLREEYKSLFYLFKADAVPLLEPRERNDWGILFAMQHHRIPTRLLDWTESFACALFFAQLGRNEGDDAAVFVLNPDELNRQSVDQSGLVSVIDDPAARANVSISEWLPSALLGADHPPLTTVAIVAPRTNARMVAQRSAFTICGDSFWPLERDYTSCITKIELPASLYEDAEGFLDVMGIGPQSYFPDLEGLAMFFAGKHRSELRFAQRMLRGDSR